MLEWYTPSEVKLPKSFYQKPAEKVAKEFLGKYLVYNSPKGKISGKIIEVEAYPAFSDKVSHGNKRTKRTEIMYKEGSHAYVYVIYGIHHQLAVVVNKKDIPEVVFIRAVIPEEGVDIMKKNFGRAIKNIKDLTKSPGNLCKSFGITLDLYGEDLTKNKLYLEDRREKTIKDKIIISSRVGISNKLEGHDKKLRLLLKN